RIFERAMRDWRKAVERLGAKNIEVERDRRRDDWIREERGVDEAGRHVTGNRSCEQQTEHRNQRHEDAACRGVERIVERETEAGADRSRGERRWCNHELGRAEGPERLTGHQLHADHARDRERCARQRAEAAGFRPRHRRSDNRAGEDRDDALDENQTEGVRNHGLADFAPPSALTVSVSDISGVNPRFGLSTMRPYFPTPLPPDCSMSGAGLCTKPIRTPSSSAMKRGGSPGSAGMKEDPVYTQELPVTTSLVARSNINCSAGSRTCLPSASHSPQISTGSPSGVLGSKWRVGARPRV